jgi:hypothetical protein
VGAQNAQNWTVSIVIGIEPKSALPASAGDGKGVLGGSKTDTA